jgi:adenylate kinase
MNIILIGPPGAGKGTLAERLISDKGLVHISTGQILRDAVANKTKVGMEAKGYMDRGALVPDSIVTQIVTDKMQEKDVQKKGFILDGFPRNLEQAKLLGGGLKKAGIKIGHVLYLEADENVIVRRLSGRRTCSKCSKNYNIYTMKPVKEGICDSCEAKLLQRDDDKEETIRKRLTVYGEQTEPLVKFYKKEGSLKTFDGNQEVDKVYSEIQKVL